MQPIASAALLASQLDLTGLAAHTQGAKHTLAAGYGNIPPIIVTIGLSVKFLAFTLIGSWGAVKAFAAFGQHKNSSGWSMVLATVVCLMIAFVGTPIGDFVWTNVVQKL